MNPRNISTAPEFVKQKNSFQKFAYSVFVFIFVAETKRKYMEAFFTLIVAYASQKVNDVDGYGSEYQPFSDIPFWTAYDALIRAYNNSLG